MALRTPLLHRPYLSAKYYDDQTRHTILHMDAYVQNIISGSPALVVYTTDRGRWAHTQSAWLIESDGLTPLWDIPPMSAKRVYWTRANHATMRRVHKTVLAMAQTMPLGPEHRRVSLMCHYVFQSAANPEIAANQYPGRTPPDPFKGIVL